ncbi:NAD(+) diphosphatase [Phaeobacter sp.]|uniref:NAD(+) diphosphatase n=1 Tax=Phaeobacter sp. TaxID=1902409 RepID=UPI0025DF824D|nr:NAD(+) diphosphatase [Phaeobacter sp.]
MQRAEEVTFAAGGVDRAAYLRDDAEKIADLWQAQETRVVVLWRGKLLCQIVSGDDDTEEPVCLSLITPQEQLAQDHAGSAIFLGKGADQAAVFAVDVSAWEPEDLDATTLGGFLDPSLQRHPELPADTAFAELRRIMTVLTREEAEFAATARALCGWHHSHRFCANCGEKSEIVQAGWQRRCPSCNTGHFPRTDPVVIMLITFGDSVLVGRSPGWPEGMYSLLAGFVEPGETLEAAVRRETFEETGVRVGDVSYLSSQPWPFPMSLMFGCAGVALSRDINIDPNEIEDALWVSRQDMMTVFAGEHDRIKQPREGAIAHFLLQNWLADTLD